jgi:hypothetical protein
MAINPLLNGAFVKKLIIALWPQKRSRRPMSIPHRADSLHVAHLQFTS